MLYEVITQRLIKAAESTPPRWGISRAAALLKVFFPYLCFDTVVKTDSE